jgi:hypothetical protein
MKWAGNDAQMGPKMKAYRILLGRPGGTRPTGRLTHRCVDYIKIYLREIGWGDMDWVDLDQDRDQWRALVNTVINLRVSNNVRKLLSICTNGGFSRRAQLHGVS